MNSQDQVWKCESLGKQYLEGVRGAIPFAEQQIELMLRIVDKACPRLRRFLDLGCGDGVLGGALLSRYPEAQGFFLDFSVTMIEAAQKKVSPISRHAVFKVQDYGHPAWTDAVKDYSPFDVIISGFSIHHQPDERKKEIYRQIFDLLVPGGLFLNLEHVASATPWIQTVFDDYFVEALCRYHQTRGTPKTPEQITSEYYHRPDKAANILAPVEAQCQWLRQIGFQHVDCYFKILELALFGGTKPA